MKFNRIDGTQTLKVRAGFWGEDGPLIFNTVNCFSHSVMSDSLRPCGLQPARLSCPWNSPGENTEVDSPTLLLGIFSTQGSNLGLLHRRQILYCLSHQGVPLTW